MATMNTHTRGPGILLAVCCAALAVCVCAAGEDYLSPSAVVADKDGKTIYVALVTAKQVAIFDVAS